jgi:hypothetical protein
MGFGASFFDLLEYMNYFPKEKPMNRVHRPHGPTVGQWSMVHGGPWTEARLELAGV